MSTNAPPRQTPTDSPQTEPTDDHTDTENRRPSETPTQTSAAEERTSAGAQATFSPTGDRLPGLFERQATFCE